MALQMSKVSWLADIDYPKYMMIHDLENTGLNILQLPRIHAKTFRHRTLISSKRTCFGFDSPSISDVATEEPGCVMWNPIPGTSWKEIVGIQFYGLSRWLSNCVSSFGERDKESYATRGSTKHSCSCPQTMKSRKRGKKCSFIAFLGFDFTLQAKVIFRPIN